MSQRKDTRKYISQWLQRLIDRHVPSSSPQWSALYEYAKLRGVKL